MYYIRTMTEQVKTATCKCCGIEYPADKKHFYTSYGKLQFSNCKECKKKKSKLNEKNRKKRDRKVYSKMYYEKKKALLASKDI